MKGYITHSSMHTKRAIFCTAAFLVILLWTAGCTSTQAPAAATPAPVPVTATAEPEPATTQATEEPTAAATVSAVTTVKTGTVIFTESGTISPKTYKTYEFRAMGEPLQEMGTKYTIIIKADKPVLGYAVTTYQADQLGGNLMTPNYVSHSDKIQWGLLEPSMVMEKVTDDTKTFSVEKEAFYSYVIDGRWMQSVDEYANTEPFEYTLTIMKGSV